MLATALSKQNTWKFDELNFFYFVASIFFLHIFQEIFELNTYYFQLYSGNKYTAHKIYKWGHDFSFDKIENVLHFRIRGWLDLNLQPTNQPL